MKRKLERIARKIKGEIERKDVVHYGIMGKEKSKGKFKPFDYANGNFVTNIVYQTMWPDKAYVQKLVDYMNKENPEYEFKVVKRS